MMKLDIIAIVRIALLLAATAIGSAVAAESREARLDRLFEDLSNAETEAEARAVEDDIWKTWIKTGDQDIDMLMQQALDRRRNYDFAGALEVLDRLVQIAPEYAEAWNQRATVNFHLERYEDSLIDISRALKYEPRHFGALAGRGVVRFRQGRQALAYQNIIAAMQIHPFLKERFMLPEPLRDGSMFEDAR